MSTRFAHSPSRILHPSSIGSALMVTTQLFQLDKCVDWGPDKKKVFRDFHAREQTQVLLSLGIFLKLQRTIFVCECVSRMNIVWKQMKREGHVWMLMCVDDAYYDGTYCTLLGFACRIRFFLCAVTVQSFRNSLSPMSIYVPSSWICPHIEISFRLQSYAL